MITLCRSEERHHRQSRKQKVWLTFNPRNSTDPFTDGFGSLKSFAEDCLAPGVDVPPYLQHDIQVVTYVRQGRLAYKNSKGHSGIIHAGEFECTTAGRGIRLRQTNASRTDWVHIFQFRLRLTAVELEPDHQQKRFSVAQRRGMLCLVASPDGRSASLRIHQNILIYSSLLDPGQHVVHPLLLGHRVWLHLVEGKAMLGNVVLTTGDSAGIKAERAVSLTAQEKTEFLLLDLTD